MADHNIFKNFHKDTAIVLFVGKTPYLELLFYKNINAFEKAKMAVTLKFLKSI